MDSDLCGTSGPPLAVIRTVDSVHYCFDGIFNETRFSELIIWPLDCNVLIMDG